MPRRLEQPLGRPMIGRTGYERKSLPGVREDVDSTEAMVRRERMQKLNMEQNCADMQRRIGSLEAMVDQMTHTMTTFSFAVLATLAQKATPADIAAAVAAEATLRQNADSAEVIARNNAITTSVNAEAAARAYADTQEGQARIAADALLQAAVDNKARKFVASFGNGLLTSFVFTHNFNTTDVFVQVFNASTGAIIVPLAVSRTANAVTITFALAVAANANRVVIIG